MTRSVTANAYHYLPAGWDREERAERPGFAIYTEPRVGGHITVDCKARGFRLGITTQGLMNSTKTYGGRGWQERLEQDATTYLFAAVNA